MLTGVVLARNEEHNIEACLAALKPHVAELLLIDMESSDRTVALAEPFGVTVLTHAWMPQFDAARNIAIPAARYDWLWFVDADERVPAAVGEFVNRLVRERGSEFEALSIPFKTWFCGKWIEHSGWWPGYTMPRVLKRGSFRFAARLHGGVEVNGRQLRLPPEPEWGIDHFSYPSLAAYVEKFNRYTAAEAELLAADHSSLDWRHGVRHMLRDLWLYYEANAGQRDGRHGWILAWLAGQYRFMAHAKRWELAARAGAANDANVPSSLDELLAVMSEELAACRAGVRGNAPRGIVFRTPLYDPSGYAEEGRLFARAMALGERPLRVEEIRWSEAACELPAQELALYKTLARGPRAAAPLAITNCIPTLVAPDEGAAVNVLRTTFEIDRIPEAWLPRLEAFDEVWVISEHNRAAFRRSGVPPEKLRVVPSGLDTELFTPLGPAWPRPEALAQRFVFLSVFDWQWRKGWDVLLAAYCTAFAVEAGVGLWLKVTRAHGHSLDAIRAQIDTVLARHGTSLAARPDVVLSDAVLAARDMPALYRAADAFVLATRGEGWGRPYLEAMACGRPVIGTAGSGNSDFMHPENSLLIPGTLVPVPEPAAQEIPPYAGGRWIEPDGAALVQILRQVAEQPEASRALGERAAQEVAERWNVPRTAERLATAAAAATAHLEQPPLGDVRPEQVRVHWEGEFFAGHSFAKVNEEVAARLAVNEQVALALTFREGFAAPWQERGRAALLGTYRERALPGGAEVTVRHAFPPHWQRPATGKWVHIQPWEFGALPRDWVPPLVDEVDEVWAPSHYVRRVYERSGVPAEKIHVIPWGIDRAVHDPSVTPLLLPTEKTCRFLFVGGAIGRKGFATLLAAYAAEFRRRDDVCLVIKDVGQNTFYRDGTARAQLAEMQRDSAAPDVLYYEAYFTPGQLASLYTACTCFAAPYQGEGFGLPILEALASGLPAIVPAGGPSDDYMRPEHGYVLPATEVESDHPWRLCGPATTWHVAHDDVRRALRQVYERREEARAKGLAAAAYVAANFTWEHTAARMTERLVALAHTEAAPPAAATLRVRRPALSACVLAENDAATLGDALASVRPFVNEIVCVVRNSNDETAGVADEYGARVYRVGSDLSVTAAANLALRKCTSDWIVWLTPQEMCVTGDLAGLPEVLAAQGPEVAGLWVTIATEAAGRRWPHPRREVRVLRNENGLEFAAPSAVSLAQQWVAAGRSLSTCALALQTLPAIGPEPAAIHWRQRVAQWQELLGQRAAAGVARFELGRLHFERGNYFHAECYWHEFLAGAGPGQPHVNDVLRLLIACYEQLSEPLRAEEHRRRLAELFPDAATEAGQHKEPRHALVLGGRA